MAFGLKRAKYDSVQYAGASIQMDQATHPQLVTWQNSTSTTTFTNIGGVGGTPTGTSVRTMLVHYKTAAGVLKNDGFIVRQCGRKQFIVQSASGGAATKTRVTLVQSGTLAAKQAYITFGYQGTGVKYASRISNRYVWDGNTRYAYTLGLSAEVAFHQTYAGPFYFTNAAGNRLPKFLAVVESAD